MAAPTSRAGRDRASDLVDLARKGFEHAHVDRRVGEVDGLALEQSADAGDQVGDQRGGRGFGEVREPPLQAGAGFVRAALRQQHADDGLAAPGQAAEADRGFEQGEAGAGHGEKIGGFRRGARGFRTWIAPNPEAV
jgi:hypothetical protein